MTRIISKIKTNIVASYLQTTPSKSPLFSYNMPTSPTLLFSVSLAVDSTFQSDYSFLLIIDGIEQDLNDYSFFPSNSSSYEFVPSTAQGGLPIGAGAIISIYVYNTGGASIDGHISISILASA